MDTGLSGGTVRPRSSSVLRSPSHCRPAVLLVDRYSSSPPCDGLVCLVLVLVVLWYNMVFQQSPRLFAKSTTDPLLTNPIKSIAHPSNLIHSLIITFFYMIVDNTYNDNEDIQRGGGGGSVQQRPWPQLCSTLHCTCRHYHLYTTIIIIITRPRPAFGRLGLGGSSGGYNSHG